MNERIQELAKEAIANVRFWNAEKEAYDIGHDELAKFAELIVRECARVANENVGAFTPSCGNFVMDHFGVER